MIELDGTLSDLARLESSGEPIVSLYLDTRWRDEQQREKVRLFVHERIRQTLGHYLPDAQGHAGLERMLRRAQDYVAGLLGQAYEADKNGLALFACESLGVWRPLAFKRSFRNALETDRIPHLMQLAHLVDEFCPAIVALPRPEGADLFQVSLGELAIQEKLRGFVPHRDRDEWNPGAAMHGRFYERTKKDQRRQESYVQKNLRASAAEVEALFDKRPESVVVLVGTSEGNALFERELPERVRQRVIARIPRPRGWESADGARRDGVLEGTAAAIAEHERTQEEAAVTHAVGQALRGGLGVVGPGDVIEALNQGRVHKLVIEDDFDRTGWQCDNCHALGENAESQELCPYCGGDLKTVTVLGEALVVRALREDAEVEVVQHGNKLHSYRGVAALLRQTTGTGLRGANHSWPSAPGANQP